MLHSWSRGKTQVLGLLAVKLAIYHRRHHIQQPNLDIGEYTVMRPAVIYHTIVTNGLSPLANFATIARFAAGLPNVSN